MVLIVGVLTCLVALMNFSFILRLIFGKIAITYSSHIVVITGCDTGFGSMLSVALNQLGFYVISTTLTKEGF